MNAIETKNLSKSFKHVKVLDNVNICIREGEIYGLVGNNGAGKSTLIRSILGVVNADNGEIIINNSSSNEGLEFERRKIGSIIDKPAVAPHLTAYENMKALALQLGAFDDSKIKDLIHKVGLNPDEPKKVKNYSKGMQQRLAIAMTLIDNPSILILDEPTDGIDPSGIFEVRELLQRLNNEDGITILISSHRLSELSRIANSYGILEKGKLIKEMRGSDLEELCKPYIKVAVKDMKIAMKVIGENFKAHEFEILPYNTIAIYDLSRNIPEISKLFVDANCPITSILQCEGDLESTFIALMGGLNNSEGGNNNEQE